MDLRVPGECVYRLPREHGVTVFLSSHLLAEVEQVAGFVGIIHEGRLMFQGRLTELRERQKSHLRLGVRRAEAASVNRLLVESGHDVFHLSVERQSLEAIFLGLTGGRSE